MIYIVGIGPGNTDYLTITAKKRIDKAQVILGGKRQLDIFDVDAKKIPIEKGIDFHKVFNTYDDIVILASGDPTIYGILDLVLRYVDKEKVEVIPGISSIQYVMAKLKMPFKKSCIVSLHGRRENLISKVLEYQRVFVLTDSINTPQNIAKMLLEKGLIDRKIYVAENLSYPGENIECYDVKELSELCFDFSLNVVVIEKCGIME